MKPKCEIFPATQFHFSVGRTITEEEIPAIIEACRIPLMGLVGGTLATDPKVKVPAIEVFGKRIIITTSHNIGVDDKAIKEAAKKFIVAFTEVLKP